MSRQTDMFGTAPTYPNTPGFKADGPSREAARAIAPLAKGIRGRVLRYFQLHFPAGMTVDEVSRDLKISPFTTRPRVSELHAQGLLEPTVDRRANDSGHSATVWRASRTAMEAAA